MQAVIDKVMRSFDQSLTGDRELKYKLSGATHIGCVRDVNQDNFYVDGVFRGLEQDTADIDNVTYEGGQWIAAVFDGMGGEKKGEIASLIAAETTKKINDEAGAPCDIGTIIDDINNGICAEMSAENCRMGSTCVYVEFDDDKYRAWNVGDSRAYLFHESELIQQTVDHTEAAYFESVFKGIFGIKIGSENKLMQFLGVPDDEFIIEPFVTEWSPVQENDIIMICTDGLTHQVSDQEICDVLGSEAPLKEKKEALLELALERGGLDNITFILIEAHS